MSNFSSLNIHIQRNLFPALEEEIGVLSSKERQFVRVLELMDIRPFLIDQRWCGTGRKPHCRVALAKAFIAKAIWNIPTTRGLIEEHLGDHLCGHVSRDATAIVGREKPLKKKGEPKIPKKRGRPRKEEKREKKTRRLEEQPGRSLKKNLKELPRVCDVGTKKNSKGYKQSWIGYKLHLDVIDGDIPVAGILTSASLHDSQVSIPLAQMTATRVASLYDLMDAAYDAPEIHAFSRRLGHVPIIDHNPRRSGVKKQMDPPEKHRYKERSSAERVNSNLKDNYGGRHVRVRGPKKVACHLMFGLVALTATQLFNLLL
ncbi:MAG: IS5/IS1182 family transposase [Verrucomicrobia bacterium]|nr:MAG: IS5/IS1182 family transposase [Verrucomicrobiota bacterium]